MSGIYNVFLKWTPADKAQTASWARYLLVFPSRYDAEKFYRHIQSVRKPNEKQLMFAGLVRSGAQFWSHGGELWYAPYEVQAAGLAEDFRYNLSTTLLNDGQAGGRAFDLISNPAQGPDWISGGAFFLRSRRQPQLYWCVHQSYVHLSTDRRSKFRIDIIPGDGEEDPKGKKVFILSDRVMVTVVQETHSGYLGDKKYVGVEDFDSEKTSRLALVSRPHPFTFDELVRSLVGVRWEEQRDAGGNVVEQRPTLAPMSEGGAEEWELC